MSFGIYKPPGPGQDKELTQEQQQEIKDAFDLFDTDADGALDMRHLKAAVRVYGFEPKNEEMQEMLRDADSDGSGKIEFAEFSRLMSAKIINGHSKVYWHRFVQRAWQLEEELNGDQAHQQKISDLLRYAKEQVDAHLPKILQNLQRFGIRALDLLWPGAGYCSVACGGNFEVLTLLQKRGLLKVGKIMGASGGACSTIFALADPDNSSKTLLKSYSGWIRYQNYEVLTDVVSNVLQGNAR